MTLGHFINRRFVWTLALLASGGIPVVAMAQPAADADGQTPAAATDDATTDDDAFAVPDGSPAELLEFIEGVAQREEPFTSQEELQEYLDNVSTAISAAADQILSLDATEQQTIDAIEWNVEALRIRGQLGDEDADARVEELLARFAEDPRQAIADAVKQIRAYRAQRKFVEEWQVKLRQLPMASTAARAEIIDELGREINSTDEVFANQVVMVTQFCDMLANTQDSDLGLRLANRVLPAFRASDNPQVQSHIPTLEGIARRLNLPGNKMELTGTTLSGDSFDWQDYRGKVVLVDFWASWCGPCLMELPNMKENYRLYHEKGFDIVGISLDDDRSEAERIVREMDIPWVSLYHEGSEDSGWQHPMAVKYGITGIPQAILVDEEGKVVHMNARGPMLGRELRRLLGEPATDSTAAEPVSEQERSVSSESS